MYRDLSRDSLYNSEMWKGKYPFVVAELARLYGTSCKKAQVLIDELIQEGALSVHYRLSSNKRVTPMYQRHDPLSYWFITKYNLL